MTRKIVDYSKLTGQILELLVEKYPRGYKPADILVYRNAAKEVIECVEVRTEDTVYLVKIGKRLTAAMEDFEEDCDVEKDRDQESTVDEQYEEYGEDPYH